MTERIVHLLEAIEVDRVQGKSIVRSCGQRSAQLLAKMEAVGKLGERVVAGKPGDLVLRLALLRYVLQEIHPATVRQRLVADLNRPAIPQLSRAGERFS